MTFAREEYSSKLIEEMMPLWKDHHTELADKYYGPLDPDLNFYTYAARSGILRVFTYREEGRLHGYQVFIVAKHPHSKSEVHATQDVLYLCPKSRRGWMASNFIEWCCAQLASEKVRYVHQPISARHDFGKVLERMGYELEDLTYSRRLT